MVDVKSALYTYAPYVGGALVKVVVDKGLVEVDKALGRAGATPVSKPSFWGKTLLGVLPIFWSTKRAEIDTALRTQGAFNLLDVAITTYQGLATGTLGIGGPRVITYTPPPSIPAPAIAAGPETTR
jgi:hypothetical protein